MLARGRESPVLTAGGSGCGAPAGRSRDLPKWRSSKLEGRQVRSRLVRAPT